MKKEVGKSKKRVELNYRYIIVKDDCYITTFNEGYIDSIDFK